MSIVFAKKVIFLSIFNLIKAKQRKNPRKLSLCKGFELYKFLKKNSTESPTQAAQA